MLVYLSNVFNWFLNAPGNLGTRIDQLNPQNLVNLPQILVDLTSYSNSTLQGKLQSKISKISKADFEKMVDNALKIKNGEPRKILETIRVSNFESLKKQFNAENLQELASREALCLPLPPLFIT